MFRVGPLTIETPLLLAPMEDVTNVAMRVIAQRIAKPGLAFTEFVSAMAVYHNPARSLPKMKRHPEEPLLGVQIFGAVPERMAESAAIAQEMGADVVDINMGCWVPKVCRTGSGAALLKDPETAAKIVESVKRAVTVPVTVKVRAGWDHTSFAAPDLARRFQDVGADMITLHARFARQGFEGVANWKLIEDLRKAVQVPLIGNGDIKEPEDAVRMMRETGCDGVMVGRAAISNPWGLARIRCALMGEPLPPLPTLEDRVETALEHIRLALINGLDCLNWEEAREHPRYAETEIHTCRSLRGQIPIYIKGEQGSSAIRQSLHTCETYDDYAQALRSALNYSNSCLALTASSCV
jgi:tRNA-dihydrouridine synthase B